MSSLCQGTCLVHIQLAVHQVLYQKAALWTVLAQGFVPPQVQDFEFAFGEAISGDFSGYFSGDLSGWNCLSDQAFFPTTCHF